VSSLSGGVNVANLVSQLMQLERIPRDNLATRRTTFQSQVNALTTLRSKLSNVQFEAKKMNELAEFGTRLATSTDEAVATATSTASASLGSTAFRVLQLASTAQSRSVNSVANTSVNVTAASVIALAKGQANAGVTSVAGGAGFVAGTNTISVTQASAGATKTGTNVLSGPIAIDETNDQMTINVNGTSRDVVLVRGNYATAEALVSAFQGSLNAVAADVDVSLTSAGTFQFQTRREGSAATLRVTGGDAALRTYLGITTDAVAITGTNAIVDANGTINTLTSIDRGASVTVNGGAGGQLVLGTANGLNVGGFTVAGVSTGTGSLDDVVNNINLAAFGVTATAAAASGGGFQLQLTSTGGGQSNAVTAASSEFTFGGFNAVAEGTDAKISIGTGVGAPTYTSATNVFTDILPGVNLTVKKLGDATVEVKRDGEALANQMQKIVDAANQALGQIKLDGSADPAKGTKGVLAGSFTLRNIQNQILDSIAGAVTGTSLVSPGLAGLAINGTGSITFDKAKFLTKFAENPDGVAELFAARGNLSNALVTFGSAGDKAPAGTYNVEVTQAATAPTTSAYTGQTTQASSQEISIRLGTTTAVYNTVVGNSLSQVAAGLNAALAAAGLTSIRADVSGVGPTEELRVQSTNFGSAVSFEAKFTNPAAFSAFSGQDVMGSIGGVTANGIGQRLFIDNASSNLFGMGLNILATTADIVGPTSLGTLDFQPGAVQRINYVASNTIDTATGSIQSTTDSINNSIKELDASITNYDYRLTLRQAALTRQWSTMNTLLSKLQGQSSSLQNLGSGGGLSSILPGIA